MECKKFVQDELPNHSFEELPKYNLDLVGLQKVRWEGGGTELKEEYTFSTERGMRIMN
jgi:hypothetical protein